MNWAYQQKKDSVYWLWLVPIVLSSAQNGSPNIRTTSGLVLEAAAIINQTGNV